MSQFHPTQHAGDNDFQMWQQQMMYKQLQEFQRRQQLQQPDHGVRMQPTFGQFHTPAKPLPPDQFSTMSNEMPNNEAANSAWPHNLASVDPSLTSNSQMLNNGSTNWDQFVGAPGMGNFMNASMFTNAQSQSMRPMGLGSHQVDQSFYPMHATNSRGSGNQYSQFLGIPADSQSAMTRGGPNQSEKTSRPFNSSMNEHDLHLQGTTSLMQNISGKGGFLNNSPMPSQGDNIKAGSPVTMNHLQVGFQVQDFHGRPNQVDFQEGVQEKSSVQVGPTSGRASLDPTEEKILFGNDEDSNWGALLRGENDHGNSLESDNLGGGAYSSLQSGSWSALMQEALQSTTSENSPKEEWSGLSFQKTEQMIANNSSLSGRDKNKLAALSGSNLENARPSPASSYADGTTHNPNVASFQHAIRTPYERRDQMTHESPSATVSNHQSTSDVNNGYFQQGLKQNQSDGRQEQVHLANGLWAHQKSELLRNNSHSTGAHAAPTNTHGFWMSQQNAADHSVNRESSGNQNDWKANNAPAQDINNAPNVFNSNENSWKASGGNANSVQRLQQMKSDISNAQMPNENSDGKNMSMKGSSMPMLTQDHYQITGRSGEQMGMNRNMGRRVPESSGSPGKSADQRPGDCNQEYLNATLNERQVHLLNHGHVANDSAAGGHSVFAGKESQNLGQSGQQAMGSYMLQNRAVGSSGMTMGHSSGNPVSSNLFPPQSHQMRNNLQHHFGTNTHVSSNTPSVNEKMLMGQEQLQSRHGVPNSSSALPFGGSDAGLSQNRAVQNSQHMLQLLHKVDNSRNGNAAADMPSNSLGVVSAQQQLNHPSLQGFGLRLAPPSQRQPTSGHLWSQTNVDGKQPDYSAQEDDRTQLPSTTGQSLMSPHPNLQSSPFHTSETDNTEQPTARFPQLSSGQQYPAAEARPGPVNMLQQPQQGSSAVVFKNVWTNISAQRLAGLQANKITPNILQSMMFPNNATPSNLWSSQKTDDPGQRAATPSDVATSSANSQSQDTKQAVDIDAGLASSQKANFELTGATASGGNESLQKPSSDGSFANPVSSFAQLRQQGIMSAKQGENPGVNFQAMNPSHNHANSGGGIVLHGNPAPSNIQQQNYSLLHQMHAMRHTDVDPGNAVGKTVKSDIGSDASPIDWKAGQRFAHVSNNSTKPSTDNIGSPGVPGSFPSDMKMLSFASRSEERNPSIPSQLPSGERPPHGMVTAQNNTQNQVQPVGTSAASNSVERSERPRINSQMAPSWFGHYGNYRNGQNVAMLNAQKATALQYNFPKASWNIDNNSAEHRVESGQPVRPGHCLPSTRMEALVPSNVKAASMIRRPKKRKSTESALVSWHKIIESPQKLRNISTSEMDWAWAANRLIEKDEAETLDDAALNYLPRKRLILTTQLIQQLLPAIPATVLRTQAVSAYESMTYTLSMLTLRDTCSMASSSLYNSCSPVDDENNPSEQTSAKKMKNKLTNAVEIFVGRIRKMENNFISLNNRASMLDVQLECQDLERISIVNRLGRFHGRNHAAAVEGSSASEMILRRIFPERHVMSFAVPGNLPEGAYCLSL